MDASCKQEDYNHAIYIGKKALAYSRKTYGADYYSNAIIMSRLAQAYKAKKEYTEAIQWQRQAVDMTDRLNWDHLILVSSLEFLGELYYLDNRFNQADSIWDITVAEIENQPCLDVNLYDKIVSKYIFNKASKGEIQYAESLATILLTIQKNCLDENFYQGITSKRKLAWLCRKADKYAEAESLMLVALNETTNRFGEYHTETEAILNELAGICIQMNKSEEAYDYNIRAARIREKLKDYPDTSNVNGD
jgi:tetratricopeptide (TPR) repeat protein